MALGVVFVIIFLILFIIVSVCFFRIIILRPSYLPLISEDYGTQERNLVLPDIFVCDQNGLPKWCWTCKRFRPDRFSHCEEVGRCCAKRDHYCPWLGGVIELRRYKFFIQFLVYTSISISYNIASIAPFIAQRTDSSPWTWLLMLGVNAFFLIFYFALLYNNIPLLLRGRSMPEHMNIKYPLLLNVAVGDKSGARHRIIVDFRQTVKRGLVWDLGWRKNLATTFGVGWWWWLPVHPTPGDGYSYEMRESYVSSIHRAAEAELERCHINGQLSTSPESPKKQK